MGRNHYIETDKIIIMVMEKRVEIEKWVQGFNGRLMVLIVQGKDRARGWCISKTKTKKNSQDITLIFFKTTRKVIYLFISLYISIYF